MPDLRSRGRAGMQPRQPNTPDICARRRCGAGAAKLRAALANRIGASRHRASLLLARPVRFEISEVATSARIVRPAPYIACITSDSRPGGPVNHRDAPSAAADRGPVHAGALPSAQYLILEVLASRWRLSEQMRTFRIRMRAALAFLQGRGMLWWEHAGIPRAARACLTDTGRAAVLLDSCMPLAERRDDLASAAPKTWAGWTWLGWVPAGSATRPDASGPATTAAGRAPGCGACRYNTHPTSARLSHWAPVSP